MLPCKANKKRRMLPERHDGTMETLQDLWMQFIAVLSTMQWNDVLDIALISFIIYKAIQLIRDTRAAQLVKGILIVVILYGIVRLTRLEMMQILFDSLVLQVGIFSVIVLFQNEIRHALEQIGRSKLSNLKILGISSGTENETVSTTLTIRAVANACQQLRNLRMGALIVFERGTSLGEIVRSGTIVDAEPSAELIGNVFFNKAPLHDGAAVIRGNRLYAAGCILPLTQNTEISSELGTRHRAAIGMSEVSDAVVVVVSEETGNISIARGGRLTRNYTKETLVSALENLLINERSGGKNGEKRLFSKPSKKKEHRN